ncbi:ABC transporter permease [Bacillus smithii]|uniref:ABC transporter permease n=1 Tax=Bacillus smithii TaxID=1479 RepID=UPI003D19F2DC
MKHIKSILNSLNIELKYQYFSYIILILFLAILSFSLFNLFIQMSNTKENYDLFLRTIKEYKELGIDINEALNTPVDIEKSETGNEGKAEVVSNILRFDYDNVALSLNNMQPERIVTHTLEWLTFLFFPFIFTVYGIYIATYDTKYKTIKVKAVKKNWNQILLSKQLSIYMISTCIIAVVLILNYIVGTILYNHISQKIPVEEFQLSSLPEDNNVVLQVLLSLFICFFFSTLGFYLGILFKGFIAPTIIFLVYNFIVPVLTKFDLRNMVSILGHEVFDFHSSFKLFEPIQMPTHLALISLIVFLILSSIISYLIAKKQSKFVV